MLPSRYLPFAASIVLFALSVAMLWDGPIWRWSTAIFGALTLVGIWDLSQTRHTLRRNFPITSHFRTFFEFFRPMLRQYVVESDTEEAPFSHSQRSLVYQRAKDVEDKRPFGTEQDLYRTQYEWINHSLAPKKIDSHDFRITIGGPQCTQPYSASVFNISAMSFGALSANAIRALNEGARLGGFYHDTGEGSMSRYHREMGGDICWEIGSGYFGCRNDDGSFSLERFAENATNAQVKLIEIKLSQGAKPGHGGVLPGVKVSPEIAEARGVPIGQDCVSPAAHSAFSTPLGLLQFIAMLREKSGGKPTGFKLALGHPWEWFGIAKAMHESGILPDFIVVDGGEGGTGAAPLEFTDHVGVPLREALLLIHNTLIGLGLRDKISIGASGKVITAFDLARTLALGADWCNAARGFMFALGCIQSQNCHTDRCPTGVATQNAGRWKKLNVPDKSTRVKNFHDNTLHALKELIAAAGLTHPGELGPEHIIRRVSPDEVRSLAALYQYLEPGDLLDGRMPDHAVFKSFWRNARTDTFAAPRAVAEAAQQIKSP
ncbi:MAG: FMN-binding glutamate synthase family protein [Rudaea sp.]|nr:MULTISPECIES: FMN-binding glutamate synthase family protein [unclassified Rudaea]MBN8885513.1 FMN-binding glutamate synthase family protein [Rudaea sp.]MBR0347572.1 FMN-binding glutamate synthase family protein [Rudaea sp.]